MTTGTVTQRTFPAAVLVLLAGEFLAIFDVSVVNVILPTLRSTFHVSGQTVYLVVAGYGLSYGSLLVLGGRLGDSFGFRRVFLVGAGIFGAASLLCGLAPDFDLLIAARIAQGVGAALLFPQVLAGIRHMVPPRSQGRAMGSFGAILGLGSTLGQIGGGVLTQVNVASAGWRTAFLVNVPVCLLVVLLGRRVLPVTAAARHQLDLLGAVLLAATLTGLVLWVSHGGLSGVIVIAAAGLLVWWELRVRRFGRTPLLDFGLLRQPSFATGLVLCLTFFGTQVPFYVVLSQTAQHRPGSGPLAAAELYAGLGVAFLVASVLAGRLDARWGAQGVLAGGLAMALSYLGLRLLSLSDLTPGVSVADGLLVVNGLGAGLVAPTLIRYVLSEIAPESAGLASGLLSTAQQTANSVGVVVSGAIDALGATVLAGFRLALLYFCALICLCAALAVLSLWLRRKPG